jgi:tetratricopeptide (TPR) repeat protein
MELRGAVVALTMLACLATVGRLGAEERDSTLRQQALKLNDITGNGPILGKVEALIKDKDGTRKLVTEAGRMVKEKPQPFNYNATRILASLASEVKDYNAAETFYRLQLDQAKQLLSVKGLVSAYGGLIVALDRNKKYAEAEKACREVLGLERDPNDDAKERKSLDSFQSRVMEEMIRSIARQGDTDRAIDVIDRILKNQPDSWLALDLKADVYIIADKPKEAIKLYHDELDRLKNDTELKKDAREELTNSIRYRLSGLYVDINQIDKAAEQLKTLLAQEPDNPTYNNDLGYIWADHDMNLAESEKLIRKAIEEERKLREKIKAKLKPEDDKDNPAYLDSLGWVLFKQKKYEEAKKYLQQAIEQEEGKHIEILDHLAEVHMALGQKAEAVAAWKKGIAAAGETKREQKRKVEVEKKIKANE